MLVTRIFSFSHSVFNSITKRNCHFSKFDILSANAFNLDMSNNLSFCKELHQRPKNVNCFLYQWMLTLVWFLSIKCFSLHNYHWVICSRYLMSWPMNLGLILFRTILFLVQCFDICDPSCKKGPNGNCEKYLPWSACADSTGWPGSKLFAIGRFSIY